jgi:hypothetical protein
MTENNLVLVVKPNQFSTRKQRLRKRLCCDWNVRFASISNNWPLNVVNTLNWEVIKRPRVLLFNFKNKIVRFEFLFMDPSDYFSTTRPPLHLAEISKKVSEFIDFNRGKPIVLVTSGGTTVPLESQTVRFLDNFSAGTRGATSAEYFIQQGYSCIFLHRQWSLEPYSRHYTHSTNCFLDLLQQDGKDVSVKKDCLDELRSNLELYQKVCE